MTNLIRKVIQCENGQNRPLVNAATDLAPAVAPAPQKPAGGDSERFSGTHAAGSVPFGAAPVAIGSRTGYSERTQGEERCDVCTRQIARLQPIFRIATHRFCGLICQKQWVQHGSKAFKRAKQETCEVCKVAEVFVYAQGRTFCSTACYEKRDKPRHSVTKPVNAWPPCEFDPRTEGISRHTAECMKYAGPCLYKPKDDKHV